jgi:hypothetical protein
MMLIPTAQALKEEALAVSKSMAHSLVMADVVQRFDKNIFNVVIIQ